jgi:hypothetical protein
MAYVKTTVFQAMLLGSFDKSTDVIEESYSSWSLLFYYEGIASKFPQKSEEFYTTQKTHTEVTNGTEQIYWLNCFVFISAHFSYLINSYITLGRYLGSPQYAIVQQKLRRNPEISYS